MLHSKKRHIFIAILLLGAIGCASQEPRLYYEGTMLRTPPPKSGEKKALISQLPQELAGRRVYQIKSGKRRLIFGGRRKAFSKLSLTELRALWFARDDEHIGAELDMKLLTSPRESLPVTVWVSLEGSMTVELGQWKHSKVPKSSTEIERRWGVGPLRAKRDAKWSKRALRSINLALSALSSKELKLIKGIPFLRKQSGSASNQAALYVQEGNCDAFIHVYNLAIKSERYTFAGEAHSALPATVLPVLHEIGHALHNYPGRALQCTYLKKVKRYNELVDRYNAGRGDRKADQAKLSRLDREIKKIKPKMDRWRERGPVLSAYARVKGASKGPTPYGESSLQESFAESFALFRVDPKALKRVFPKVYTWFRKGGHLKAIK